VARWPQEPALIRIPSPDDLLANPDPEVIERYDAAGTVTTAEELEKLFWMQNHPDHEERQQDIIDQQYDYNSAVVWLGA